MPRQASKLESDISKDIGLRLSSTFKNLNICGEGGCIQVLRSCGEGVYPQVITECTLEVNFIILEVEIYVPHLGYQFLHLHLSDPTCFDQVYEALKKTIEEN